MQKFEQQIKALEAIVDKMENGDLSLEDSLKVYEEGIALSKACKLELEAAEGKIQVLAARESGRKEAVDLDLES